MSCNYLPHLSVYIFHVIGSLFDNRFQRHIFDGSPYFHRWVNEPGNNLTIWFAQECISWIQTSSNRNTHKLQLGFCRAVTRGITGTKENQRQIWLVRHRAMEHSRVQKQTHTCIVIWLGSKKISKFQITPLVSLEQPRQEGIDFVFLCSSWLSTTIIVLVKKIMLISSARDDVEELHHSYVAC